MKDSDLIKSMYPEAVDFWDRHMKKTHPDGIGLDVAWIGKGGMEGKNLKYILKKILVLYRSRVPDQDIEKQREMVLLFWDKFLLNWDRWPPFYRKYSLAFINSKFEDITSELGKNNGRSEQKTIDKTEEIIRRRFGSKKNA